MVSAISCLLAMVKRWLLKCRDAGQESQPRTMPASQCPEDASWLTDTFDPDKAATGYTVSSDGRTAMLKSGPAYYTVQGCRPIRRVDGQVNRFYFGAMFSGLVGGIGLSHLNDKTQLNLYNDHSFLLSGYGDLYNVGGSLKGYAPNISRSNGSHYGCLIDMDEGTLQYWLDGVELSCVKHDSLRSGEWYITVTFGSGSSGAAFELLSE